MGKQELKQWEGETKVEIQNFSPKQIWPLISDFCSLDKWSPHLKSCYLVQGVPGEVGMVRYCGSTECPADDTQWATEKLIMIDSASMSFSYEIDENNIGFKTYVATIRLESIEGCDGCRIVWSFVSDPVDGLTLEGLVGFIDSTAQGMAKGMEEALLNSL